MSERLVTRFVKGPKPMWVHGKDGVHAPAQPGAKIEISARTAKAKSHQLLTPAEFKANNAAADAAVQASQDEKDERSPEAEPEKEKAAPKVAPKSSGSSK